MADLNISLGIDVETASIREVQSKLTEAIRNVDATIALDVEQNQLNAIIRQVAQGPYTLENLSVDPQARQELSQIISQGLTIKVQSVAVESITPAKKALLDLKDKVESQLRQVEAQFLVQAKLEQTTGRGRPGLTNQLKSDAESTGLSTKTADLQRQRLEVFGRSVNLQGQLQVINQRLLGILTANVAEISDLTSIYNENQNARKNELKASTKNFQVNSRAVKIIEDLNDARIDGVQATRKLEREQLRVIEATTGAAAAMETIQGGLLTASREIEKFARAQDLAEEVLSQLLISQRRNKEQLDSDTAILKTNQTSLEKLAAINNALGISAAALQKSYEQAANVVPEGNVFEGTGKFVADAQEELFASIERRRAVLDQASASGKRFAEASEEAASQVKIQADNLKKNSSSLDKIAEINRNLVTTGASLERAQRKAAEISPQGNTSGGSGKLVDEAQLALFKNIESRRTVLRQATKSDRRFAEAAEESASQIKIHAENLRQNSSSLDKIAEINRGLETSGASLKRAQERAAQIEPQGNTSSGSGKLVDDALEQLVSSIEQRKRVLDQASASDRIFASAAEAAATDVAAFAAASKANKTSMSKLSAINLNLTNTASALRKAYERAIAVTPQGDDSSGKEVATFQEALLTNIERRITALNQASASDRLFAKAARDAATEVKRQAEADAALNMTLFELQKEADRNTSSLKKMALIALEVDDDLTNLASAIKAAQRIEVVGDTSQGLAQIAADQKAALLRRLRSDKQLADGAARSLAIEKDIEDGVKEEDRIISKQNKELRKSLGIISEQTSAAKTIFASLEESARTVKDGQGLISKAFEFTAAKIREGARNLGRNKGKPLSARKPKFGASSQSTVTFRNAGEVKDFADSLNASQLGKFSSALGEVANGTKSAQKAMEGYQQALGRTDKTQKKLSKSMAAGQGFARNFGAQVLIAAKRLAAWAAPSAIIFSTISRLKAAVSEIVEIDNQARRLIFFTNAGGIITQSGRALSQFSKVDFGPLNAALDATQTNTKKLVTETAKLKVSNQGLSDQFNTITKISKDYGLSIQDTTQALLEVARVGQSVTKETSDSASAFTDAALSLVRVEAGALGAAEAVRGLQAIQAQFFGGKGGAIFSEFANSTDAATIAMQAASNAAAVLAVTSAGSAASVSELIDATTRLGSAFVNITGLNFEQTIAIIGEAFTATGATTGRLATALRQTATLIAQNAEEIGKLAPAIEVVNVDGTLKGFESILDVLQQIKDDAGSLASTELSLLIADRRNVADIQALAQSVDTLRTSFTKFGNPVLAVNAQVAAAVKLFDQNKDAVEGLEGQINNLNTSIVQLVESSEFRTFLGEVITLAQQGITFFEGFGKAVVETATKLAPLGAVLVAIGAAIAAKGIANFSIGFLRAAVGADKLKVAVQSTVDELRAGKITTETLTAASKERLLTAKQILRIQTEQRRNGLQRIGLEDKLKNITREINQTQGRGREQTKRRLTLRKQEKTTLEEIARLEQRITDQTRRSANEAERAGKAQQTRKNRGRAAVGAGFAVGALASSFASSFESPVGDGIASAINNGLTLAAAGATIGGPAGALAGAVAGLVGTGLKFAVDAALAESAEDISARGALKAQEKEGGIEDDIGLAIRTLRQVEDSFSGPKRKKFDFLGLLNLEQAGKRLRDTKNELEELGKTEAKQGGKLDENQKRLAVGLKARLAGEIKSLAIINQQVLKRRVGITIGKVSTALLAEQNKLGSVLADTSASVNDKVKASIRLKQIENRLGRQDFAILKNVRQATADALINTEKRAEALKRINKESEVQAVLASAILAIPVGEKNKLKLQIELEDRALRKVLADTKRELDKLATAEASGLKGGEQLGKEKLVQEEKAVKATREGLLRLIKRQQSVLDSANKNIETRIKAWESASSRVTKAFSNIVESQRQLAGIFANIGAANAAIIERTSAAIQSGLDSSGASIAGRLEAVFKQSQASLGNARSVGRAQQSTLGARFGGAGDIAAAGKNLVKILSLEISKSDEKITRARTAVVDIEAAKSRELSKLARADFESRIKETRRAISVRKTLLTAEISAFEQRFNAEKQLNELRRSQQEEFGRLLIESPEEFKKTLNNVSSATNFFKGITDINVDSLKTLQSRANKLRESGPQGQEALRTILSGIQSAGALGQPDIISGVGNRQLEQIFTRVQRENTDSLANDLQAQKDELNSQSQIQREIDARQKALVELAKFDATIQQNLLALAQSEGQIAINQRDVQVSLLQGIEKEAIRARNDLSSGIRDIRNVLSTGAGNVGSSQFAKDASKLIKDLRISIGVQAKGLTEGGRENLTALTAILDRAQEAFGKDVGAASKEARPDTAARKKLSDILEESRKKHIESVGAVTDFTAALRESKVQLDAQTDATKKQTGLGVSDKTGPTKVGDLVGDFRNDLKNQSNTGANKFIARELAELNKRDDTGGQLTKQERNDRRDLERLGKKNFSNDARGGRQLARRLLDNGQSRKGIVGKFRSTLKDTSSNNDFIDRARRLRGEGSRGRRGIDLKSVKKFLEGSGFEGAAESISTKGQAANVLDRFIEISERLSKEQGNISKETKKQIVTVLGEELRTGIAGVLTAAQQAAVDATIANAEEAKKQAERQGSQAAEVAKTLINKIREVAISDELIEKIKSAQIEGGEQAARAMSVAIESSVRSLNETKLKVDLGDLHSQITIRVPDSLTEAQLQSLFARALAGTSGTNKQVDAISRKLAKLYEDLVKQRIVKPVFDAEAIIGPDRSDNPIKFTDFQ